LTPSPIGKVLSIFRKNRVRALLMGGQACILYGAAEFSGDIAAVLASDTNLQSLRNAEATAGRSFADCRLDHFDQ
jgi:hypothetical protein